MLKSFFKFNFSPALGFSLTETLIAVAIIGIIASITIPFFRDASLTLNLNAAGRDLASDLRLAQQLAVTTQVNHQVVFNLSGNYYTITNLNSGAVVKMRNIKSPVSISAITNLPTSTVIFNSTGAANNSGTVTLINTSNRQLIIEIKPSGYVKIN